MSEFTKRSVTAFVLIIIIYFSYKNLIFLTFSLFFINYLLFYEFNSIFKKIFKSQKFLHFLSDIIVLMYIVAISLCVWFFLNSSIHLYKLSLIFIILICVSSDIGGFCFGKTFGGKKLTKISPNKTYSGVLGSFIFSLIFGYLFSNIINESTLNGKNIIILILIISFVCQIGDLFISFLKRKAKIKDTGVILPGHGGILDRLDGILLSLPFGSILILI